MSGAVWLGPAGSGPVGTWIGTGPSRNLVEGGPPGNPRFAASRGWQLALGKEIGGAHPRELAGVGRVVDGVGGEAWAVGDTDDEGGEHGGEAGPKHRVDIGAGVGDLRGEGPQEGGEQVAELAAIEGATTVDFRVHAGYQHDC